MEDFEKYLETEIKLIPVTTLKEMLKSHVVDLYRDCGQSMDAEEITYLCKRVFDVLTGKHRSWKWFHVRRTFERGLAEEFGTWRKVTVKLIFSWLYNTEESLRRKRETQNQQREAEQVRKAPHIYAKNAQLYGQRIKKDLKKDPDSEWGEEYQQSFAKIKAKVQRV